MKHSILITHAAADASTASLVRNALEAGGMSCVQASDPQNANKHREELVDMNDAMVLIVSTSISESAEIRGEVERASNAGKVLIPFRLDTEPLSKQLEFYLSTAHWLDASNPPREEHLTQLVSTARHLLGLDRPRIAKKALAAMIIGILGLMLGGLVFGPVAVILGKLELRAIAANRSFKAGRRYARIGIIAGYLAFANGIFVALYFWRIGSNPFMDSSDWLARWLIG